MFFTEEFIKENIFVDTDAEIFYGSEQMNVSFPRRFATVTIPLQCTYEMAKIVDKIRWEMGHKPMCPFGNLTDADCDQEGWYDFYIGLNGLSDVLVGLCIEVYTANFEDEDDGERYSIELNDEERWNIRKRLDDECKKLIGKNCAELLKEAELDM